MESCLKHSCRWWWGRAGSQDNDWDERQVPAAHQIGCNAVSWAPAAFPASATLPVAATAERERERERARERARERERAAE